MLRTTAFLLRTALPAPRRVISCVMRSFSSYPPHEVIGLPSLSPTMDTGNMAKWNKKEGDEIAAGDIVCEIETDKAVVDYEATDDMFLAKILIPEGAENIPVGQPMMVVCEEEESIAAFKNFQLEDASAAPPASPVVSEDVSGSSKTQESVISQDSLVDVPTAEKTVTTPAVPAAPRLWVLRTFHALPVHKEVAGKTGAMKAIVNAMERHITNDTVQEDGCHALRSCCIPLLWYLNLVLAREQGAILAVINAMKLHPENEALQAEGCWALLVFCSNTEENDAVVKPHALLIYKAVAAYPKNTDIQSRGRFLMNSYGELMLDDRMDRNHPTQVDFGNRNDDKRVIDVACGNEQTVILFDHGDVVACGNNERYVEVLWFLYQSALLVTLSLLVSGQCAIGTTEQVPTLRFLPALSSYRTVRIFSGNGSEHVAALSADGNLYTVGYNKNGQLGLGTATNVAEATLVRELAGKRVVEVSCSYFHTAIVIDNGDLYGCGCNDYGQLGLGDYNGQLVPQPVEYFFRHPVLAVACGQHYTVASLRDGGVVAFGKNDHGQLGLDSTSEPVLYPTRLAPPLDRAMVPQLSCGYHHTAIVTVDGAVYTFGRNDYGQLGLGHKLHMFRPTVVKSLSRMRITQVACGCYHTLALSDDGKVFPFGRNNHGQLGLETSVDCLSPQLISALRSKTVTKIAAGFYHSVCLTGTSQRKTQSTKGTGTLSADLRKMLNNPTRSDVTFLVEGRQFFAHSCILIARCEPLEKMLDGRMKDGSQSEIVIPEYSYDVFAALIEFLYSDQVATLNSPDLTAGTHISDNAIECVVIVYFMRVFLPLYFTLELHALADHYLIASLRSLCENALLRILSVENVAIIIESAHFRDAFTLKKRCSGFIMDHFARVVTTPAFLGLPQELLQEMLLLATQQGLSIAN
ncbi:hypothetical protein KXD40_003811 [Peronospora effusa]|nr:hypothetical protein KXD40_003811 [Peronospora effusa]